MSGITGGTVGPEFGWTIRERSINDSGIGTFIYPKPNRLVIIKPNYSHCIKRLMSVLGTLCVVPLLVFIKLKLRPVINTGRFNVIKTDVLHAKSVEKTAITLS